MRAVTIREPGGPEAMVLTDLPLPEPGPGEVLVRVMAAGLNRPDLMQRQGLYPPPPGASPILGLEIAGEIVAVGPVTTSPGTPAGSVPAIGTRVCALTNGGGYADYCVVPAGQCLPWPDGYDAIRAAALPETFFTVWSNLVMTAHLAAGERVLIHGGSGGIGTAAIQVARALGAVPYATAGSADKCAQCVALGAEAAIDYRHEDFVDRIAALTDKRGVDVILDVIGGPYLERNLRCLAPDGRLVIIALQGGARAQDVGLARIMTRRLTVTGTTLRPRDAAYKARIAQGLHQTIWPLLAKRIIAPLIHATFPFPHVTEAHKLMESGVHSGKIVLDMQAG
ncbi:zinc-dependent alcohol dehydrogenase [Gluconacetobacter johannae DSM 13595]|uniref:NAD(P)H-quinone oxidoreductase n=1 Tax=Gluconacetobacter johannae TaxID=112140 RepID=A0A7W4JA53_9PROT|nr:NAD(P)H-quinone oxidoreductase [Gluconacetobacter johannae]MBB2177511.1 NAD(P)H-quinone oxidoreductase [Gluconacetobacter johannae]GBQ81083.1 zinc-dependent alcohol dehydrogenase [Gluconacetobacter johannae DSM 13595]